MNHLSDVGINVLEENCNDVLKELFDKNRDKCVILEKNGITYVLLAIDEDIELWFPIINGYLNPTNLGLHYNSGTIIELNDVRVISTNEHKTEGLLTGVNKAFYINVTVPNLAFAPKFYEEETYKCIVSCFAEKVDFYKSEEKYKNNHPLGQKINYQAFVPVGMFDKENQSSIALINGVIKDIKGKVNSLTNQRFYIITIECYENDFELLVAYEGVPNGIEIGDIISGQFFISGKVI